MVNILRLIGAIVYCLIVFKFYVPSDFFYNNVVNRICWIAAITCKLTTPPFGSATAIILMVFTDLTERLNRRTTQTNTECRYRRRDDSYIYIHLNIFFLLRFHANEIVLLMDILWTDVCSVSSIVLDVSRVDYMVFAVDFLFFFNFRNWIS